MTGLNLVNTTSVKLEAVDTVEVVSAAANTKGVRIAICGVFAGYGGSGTGAEIRQGGDTVLFTDARQTENASTREHIGDIYVDAGKNIELIVGRATNKAWITYEVLT